MRPDTQEFAGTSRELLAAPSIHSQNPSHFDHDDDEPIPEKTKKTRPICVILAIVIVALVIAGAVIGALIGTKTIKIGGSKSGATSTTSTDDPFPAPSGNTTVQNMVCSTSADIPEKMRGTWMDPTTWLDTTDFNCTFTARTVGDLPIVGLPSSWDDSKQANSRVPPLNKPWSRGQPFRGVSLGGWLALEPFITPSLFDNSSPAGDEYSLCAKLGPQAAAATLEKHYSTFITEADFKAIAAAGLDHVRIPFSYWAVKTYDNDPYVAGVSWRYLLRGIEWARKYGLRVKLDLHGAPGSQNGWNHSGKEGKIDWLVGPNGATNAQRTLDLHNQLSKFFAQERYKNVVAFYGLVNEPGRDIAQDDLIKWTQQAYKIVNDNGVKATIVFSESMRGLSPWAGKLTGYGDKLAIDVHEYTLFDGALTKLKRTERIQFACKNWVDQVSAGASTSTGFGPVMVGEWSQANTDCTKYLNGVGNGARWVGTFSGQGAPMCPTQDTQCNCEKANADASTFTADQKLFYQTFAEAQMYAFEKSWGWFYWTWKTESAPLWSYQAGLAGKYLPALAYERSWDCSKPMPTFDNLPEYY